MSLTLNEELGYLPGGFFTCRLDGERNLLYINRELLSLSRTHSLEQFSELTGGTLLGLVHPDERERIDRALQTGEAFDGSRLRGLEFRLKTNDATIRYVGCYGRIDAEQGLLHCLLTDITLRTEEALDVLRRKDLYHDLYRKARLSEERFRFISSFAGVMFYEYDLTNRENSKFENSLEVLGYTEWEMQQIFCESKTMDCLQHLMSEEDYAKTEEFYGNFHENGEAEGELRIRRKDGSYHWFYDNRCLVLSQNGEGSFIRGCLWNADKTHQLISGLWQSSEHDALTGLYNKISGFAAAQSRLDEGVASCAFLLFDIDELKLVNDTLGHQLGDGLLRFVAAELVRVFGNSTVVGRFGGDAFFVFLPSVKEHNAVLAKIKRLLFSLKGAKQAEEMGVELSVSAGVVFSTDDKEISELYEKAERALRQAKLLGKGHYRVYEETTALSVDDPDTMGLREKRAFLVNVGQMLANAPKDKSFVLVSVGIENYSLFNEWFGARLSDKYIAELSYILREMEAKHYALVSYFGQDSFGMLMPDERALLCELEGRLVGLCKSLSGTVAFLPALGACPIESDEVPLGTVLSRAAEAREGVYGNHRRRFAYYRPAPLLRDVERDELLSEIRDGVKKQEFVPYLCPRADFTTGSIVGAEMVSRWIRPEGHTLGEENYLGLLAGLGLTPILHRALWEKLLIQLRTLADAGHAVIPPICVRISYMDLCSMDVRATLDALIEKYGFHSSRFCVEISEAEYMENEDFADAEISRLRNGGYSVYMEVRPSYAALRKLKDLHIDGIKLSAEYFEECGDGEGDSVRIFEALLALSRQLSLAVTVCGVRERKLGERLSALGYSVVQGDACYPAVTVSGFGTLLDKHLVRPESGATTLV